MTYYFEIRSSKERVGAPVLIPASKLTLTTGFRSVYGFTEETAEHIKQTRSTAGLKGTPVYAEEILIDFDDQYDEANKFRESLIKDNISFTAYDSGNRSVHFHVPHAPICEEWVPLAHKQWVLSRTKLADTSFYHAVGMFRLPLTVHEKTGKLKLVVDSHEGALLTLTKPAKPERITSLKADSSGKLKHRFFLNLTKRVGSGGRSTHVSCMLARDAYRLGLSEDECFAQVKKWNDNFASPPHSDDTLRSKIEYEYRKQHG